MNRLNKDEINTVRAALLDVIDKGCTCESGEKHPWEFYGSLLDITNHDTPDEDIANQQRLRFSDAVIARIAEPEQKQEVDQEPLIGGKGNDC